jgi:hypothetical protein
MSASIFDFCVSCCIPRWNNYVVDRVTRQNPERVRHTVTLFLLPQQRTLEQGIAANEMVKDGNEPPDGNPNALSEDKILVQPPTSLVLRTKVYHAKKREKEMEHGAEDTGSKPDEISCMICFSPLLDGQQGGSLICDHLFHVECLKMWLPKQNVCPLFKAKDVATPRYDDVALK